MEPRAMQARRTPMSGDWWNLGRIMRQLGVQRGPFWGSLRPPAIAGADGAGAGAGRDLRRPWAGRGRPFGRQPGLSGAGGQWRLGGGAAWAVAGRYPHTFAADGDA